MTETKPLESMTRGERIVYFRDKRDMTQLELAYATKLTPGYISKLEKGKIGRPSHDALVAIATALKMARKWVD